MQYFNLQFYHRVYPGRGGLKKKTAVTTAAVVGLGIVLVFNSMSAAESGKKAPAQAPAPMAAPASPAPPVAMVSGAVVSSMKGGGYTYLEIERADKKRTWIAVPQTAAVVGDKVELKGGMVMDGFTSKTLNKTFDSIIFADAVTIQGKDNAMTATPPKTPAAAAAPHPGQGTPQKQEIKPGSIAKAKGGYTVAEVFAKKDSLKGKKISVRGKVTKVSAGIMGKNWAHLQDGTGKEGTNDLTVTSSQTVKVGDVVLASGTLAADKDFGMGYFYDAIVEDVAFSK